MEKEIHGQLFHIDTTTLIFCNENGRNECQNSYIIQCSMTDDMLRDLLSMFQNLCVQFFRLEKKVVGSVERNKNSNLSLLSLLISASFGFKCVKCVWKQVKHKRKVVATRCTPIMSYNHTISQPFDQSISHTYCYNQHGYNRGYNDYYY